MIKTYFSLKENEYKSMGEGWRGFSSVDYIETWVFYYWYSDKFFRLKCKGVFVL
jgi:hypothetical protein